MWSAGWPPPGTGSRETPTSCWSPTPATTVHDWPTSWPTCRSPCWCGCGRIGSCAARPHHSRPARWDGPAVTAPSSPSATPATWGEPDITTHTQTRLYGPALIRAWNRLHPRLTHRIAWAAHAGKLPILEGTVIRLEVDRLPSGAIPKPVWLWHSHAGLTSGEVDLAWQAFLRRFDIEHTFRMLKQTLGWTTPKLRSPAAADRWTWLLLAAYTQLRLARGMVADLRRPWEKPMPEHRLTPARAGVPNRQLAPRHDVHIMTSANTRKPSRGKKKPSNNPRPRRADQGRCRPVPPWTAPPGAVAGQDLDHARADTPCPVPRLRHRGVARRPQARSSRSPQHQRGDRVESAGRRDPRQVQTLSAPRQTGSSNLTGHRDCGGNAACA
jgi:hypothetical protein